MQGPAHRAAPGTGACAPARPRFVGQGHAVRGPAFLLLYLGLSVFWATVALNVAAVLVLGSPLGAALVGAAD